MFNVAEEFFKKTNERNNVISYSQKATRLYNQCLKTIDACACEGKYETDFSFLFDSQGEAETMRSALKEKFSGAGFLVDTRLGSSDNQLMIEVEIHVSWALEGVSA